MTTSRATRRAVLDAARDLFVLKGHAAATIDEIATAAEVSRPTVFSVGSKPTLLKLVRDIAIAGDDDPVGVPDREPVAQMRAAPDPEATLRLPAGTVVSINGRYVDIDEVLRQAAGAHPELRDLWEASEAERLRGEGDAGPRRSPSFNPAHRGVSATCANWVVLSAAPHAPGAARPSLPIGRC